MDISCANVLLTAPAPHVSQPRSAVHAARSSSRSSWGALVLTSVHAAFAATQGPGGQAQADENLVTGVKSPENATINLFDYWIIAEDTPDDNDPSNWRDVGINQGHELRFSDAGRYENPTSNSINAWTGTSGKPYFGIVQPTLGQDGYPVLKAGNIYQSQGGANDLRPVPRVSLQRCVRARQANPS